MTELERCSSGESGFVEGLALAVEGYLLQMAEESNGDARLASRIQGVSEGKMQLGGNPQWQREKARIAEMYRAEVEQVQREYRRQM